MTREKAPAVVTVDRYPDGSFSGVVYIPHGKGSDGGSWWSELTDAEREELNRQRVGRRAGQKVRRLVRHGNLRRLLTFTNGDHGTAGWTTLREALASFSRWYRREGFRLLGPTAIVVVPERGGENFRIHLHAAIKKGYRLDYNQIRESWSAHLEAEGFHSLTGTHRFHAGDDSGRHAQGFSSSRTCAQYMAKYLSKTFAEEGRVEQERRYRAEGISIPEPQRLYGLRIGNVCDVLADTFPGADITPYTDSDGLLAGYWFDASPP